jgi:desulfoferrodoxin-like iron-binding protein
MSERTGTQYECKTCGARVVVLKPGSGTLSCHLEAMAAVEKA